MRPIATKQVIGFLVLAFAGVLITGCGTSAPPPPDAAQSAAIVQEEVHVPTTPVKAKKR